MSDTITLDQTVAYETSQATGRLRWVARQKIIAPWERELEQEFQVVRQVVIDDDDMKTVAVRLEWRTVPTVIEQEQK
jgi:hypothetical protein